jgi:hypothetical protein
LAILLKDEQILELLLEAAHKQKQQFWINCQKELSKTISSLPDFELEMKWACESSVIPFIKKIAPNDVYKVLQFFTS